MTSPLNHPEYLDELTERLRQDVQGTEFPGFEAVRTDSEFLEKFIRVKDGNVEAALKAVKKYYACIQRNRSFLHGVSSGDLTEVLNCGTIDMLPGYFNGVKVLCIRMRNWNPKKVDLRGFQLGLLYLIESYNLDAVTQEHGLGVIVDLQGLRFEHAWRATPREMYRMINAFLDGLPLRVKGLHFLNPPAIFWPIHKIIIRFVKDKMRNRIALHDSNESLHNHFEKERLPISLGGPLEEADGVERHVVEKLLIESIHFDEFWNPTVAEKRLGGKTA